MKLLFENKLKSKKGRGIYCIECLKNGKRYIGSSINLMGRYYLHKNELVHNKHKVTELQKDFNLYGANEFEFNVLEEIIIEDLQYLLDREMFYIKLLKSCNEGYNKNENIKHEIRGTNIPKTVYCKNLITQEVLQFNSVNACADYLFDYSAKNNYNDSLKTCKNRVSEICNQSRKTKKTFGYRNHVFAFNVEGLSVMEDSMIGNAKKPKPIYVVELNMKFPSVNTAAIYLTELLGKKVWDSCIRESMKKTKKFLGYNFRWI